MDLAEGLRLGGRLEEGARTLRSVRWSSEQRGNVLVAARAPTLLDELRQS
jgi:hypothetical protein